ncbi:tetratricopeptide (TPR) repeat protein [Crossiella equi]|uniref:Tetratricopeptide (TPR) repeat protein n=1 Tax=Crossiella equi TaxID=130796 RepID=A0ABS5AAL9_9PSEU|nr:tetratricopeptide repeat protein [Crossiella equi]MBP2473361.1 tetratricopeptide (TPR) repeat protein [Crossiella equi]
MEVRNTANHVGVQAGAVHGDVHVHPARRVPRRLGAVPLLADAFQDRADLAAPAPGETTVLVGLGGVGKTQLAASQALAAEPGLGLLLWLTATSREAVLNGYATAVEELTGCQPKDPARLLAWLAEFPEPWLVVLDDVREPGHLAGLWPPHTPTGRTIVTTRRQDSALRGRHRRIVPVELFRAEQSEAYLAEKLAHAPELLPGAAALAADLGHLPLALAQAAAYLDDRAITCEQYRRRFADRRRSLGSLLPERCSLPDSHRDTVATTWSMSVELANSLEPAGLAVELLELASVFDPNGIPVSLFTADPAGPHTVDDVLAGLRCLHRLSLVTFDRNAPQPVVRVHALVQRVVREGLGDRGLQVKCGYAAGLLLEVWATAGPTDAALLRANTEAVHELLGEDIWQPPLYLVLVEAGTSLTHGGQTVAAISYFDQLCDTAAERLGHADKGTVICRFRQAEAYQYNGDTERALTLYGELAPVCARVNGEEHRSTLAAREGVAHCLGVLGDPAAALTLYREVLAVTTRLHGPGHPSIFRVRKAVADCYEDLADPDRALAELTAVLEDQLRVLSPDDESVLATRAAMVQCAARDGGSEAAMNAFRGLVAEYERVLGADSNNALVCRENMAVYAADAGHHDFARAEFRRLLNDHVRLHGPEHAYTRHIARLLAETEGTPRPDDPDGESPST